MSDQRGPSPDTMSHRDAALDQTFPPLDQTLTPSRSDIDATRIYIGFKPSIEPSETTEPIEEIVSSPQAASEPKATAVNNMSPSAQSASADDPLSREAISPKRPIPFDCASSLKDKNQWQLAAYLEFWNAASPRFERARVTDRRTAKLQVRIDGGMTTREFEEAVQKVASSELCKRKRPALEWFLGDRNWRNGKFVCPYLDTYPFF